MGDWKGKGIWRPVLAEDVLEALSKWRGCCATYVVANIMREQERYRHVKTSQVLHRLKRMEEAGLVRRVTDRRNFYATMLMWELPETTRHEIGPVLGEQEQGRMIREKRIRREDMTIKQARQALDEAFRHGDIDADTYIEERNALDYAHGEAQSAMDDQQRRVSA